MKKNRRVVEVWMDELKHYIYDAYAGDLKKKTD